MMTQSDSLKAPFSDEHPPSNIAVEQLLVGTILAFPDSLNNVMATLTPEMFYDTRLRMTYKCCLDTNKKYGSFDMATVNTELKQRGSEDSINYLAGLANEVCTSAMIDIHGLVIREMFVTRGVVAFANMIKESAYTDDLADTIAKAEKGILDLSGRLHAKEPKVLGSIIDEVISYVDKMNRGEIELWGIPSGFAALDRLTSGFARGSLTYIAGRPSLGKTALALQIAKNAAESKFNVGIFSLEMSQFQEGIRFLSGVSGYTNVQLKNKGCDIEHLVKTSEPLQQLGIYIDDTAGISLPELRSKTRKMVLQHGIQLMIIDYLQLMTGNKGKQNREQEVSEISAGLKAIAIDFDIAVVALSQVNRKSEDRRDKRAYLSDLRESGSLEQDADLVLLIHRPERATDEKYYKTPEGKDISVDGLIVLDIAKHRNGACGEIYLRHNTAMTKIEEYEQ